MNGNCFKDGKQKPLEKGPAAGKPPEQRVQDPKLGRELRSAHEAAIHQKAMEAERNAPDRAGTTVRFTMPEYRVSLPERRDFTEEEIAGVREKFEKAIIAKSQKKLQVVEAPEGIGILIKGVTLEELRTMLKDSKVQLEDISQTLKAEKLESLARFIQTLEIKE